MKRPILIITLGFLIGIILGLYLNIAPFLFLILISLTFILKVIKIKSKNNYIRLLKIFVKNNIILIFFIGAFLASIYIINCKLRYEEVYKNFDKDEIIATVISSKKETEYKNTYHIKLEEYKDINFLLRISKNKNIELNYGDKVKIKGEYIIPEIARNYGGFNYREYLKTKKIYGIFEASKVQVITHNKLSKIELISYNMKQKIITSINKILPGDTRELFLGILIGYDDNLQDDIQESFRKSSLTHLLAVSGAHIAYIITGLDFLLKKLKISKRITRVITIIFLIFFMYITDFSSSVVRASIMGIIMLLSLLIYKKNDIITSICLSLLMILLENPYRILDLGLLLSYFATIGIICFSKFIKNTDDINNNIYLKLINYLKELILITVFSNIFIIPIMIYNFNTISLTFIISNLIAGILIGPITIGGFIIVIILLFNIKLSYLISIPYNLLLEILIQSTKITSCIPFSEIFVPTPNIIIIIIYYLILSLIILSIYLNKKDSSRYLTRKLLIFIRNVFKIFKTKYKSIIVFCILIIIIFSLLKVIPKKLKIYFIDVGQGDSTLIITPTNKRILVDSGGAESGNFDVGKSTLLPYLLDKNVTILDYILISHFDSDHCDGFKYLLKNIKIKNIILSKQYESTKNFEEIISIAKDKKINILSVEEGNIINIDKYMRFKILSPGKDLTNDINDNSIVMKLEYLKFSCLFTGDISKNIERELVKKYGNYLKADVLKVAHHGSSTSSDESFIQAINPCISLIGVGKNNKFGHPNEDVLQTLKKVNSTIFRTDLNGEIVLIVNRKRRNKN